jgi:hypothetical protein
VLVYSGGITTTANVTSVGGRCGGEGVWICSSKGAEDTGTRVRKEVGKCAVVEAGESGDEFGRDWSGGGGDNGCGDCYKTMIMGEELNVLMIFMRGVYRPRRCLYWMIFIRIFFLFSDDFWRDFFLDTGPVDRSFWI